MKRKVVTLLTVSMICLSSCGKADDVEPVISEAIETPDQQEVEEETIVEEDIIEEEPEQEVVEADTVEEDKETDTTSQTNGAGEQITPKEEDYFKEAEELWTLHQDELDVNWETFRSSYSEERLNGSTKEEAYQTLYDLFKFIEEETVEETKPAKTVTATTSQSSTNQQQYDNDEPAPNVTDADLNSWAAQLGLPPQNTNFQEYEGFEVTGYTTGLEAQ